MIYKFKDIKRDSFKIEDSGFDFDKYEMYYIRFKLNNGRNKVVRAFVDKGTFSKNPDIQNLKWNKSEYRLFLRDFFVSKLFGTNGYMHEDGRADMIYFGTITMSAHNRALINRKHINANGKSAYEEFENSLAMLKMQVAQKEVFKKMKRCRQEEGKSYVVSDIHGMYGSYMDAVKQLKSNDILYVLGDVIDRGEYGIEIIQDMMKRDNVNFVVGNHEWYMLKTIDILRKNGLEERDLRQALSAIQEEAKKMIREDYVFIYLWLFNNKGMKTIIKYLELPKREQEQIYLYLSNSAMIQKVETKNSKVCLVHACPPDDKAFIDLIESREDAMVTFDEVNRNLDERYIEYMLEERQDARGFELWASRGYVTVYGHTPQESARIYIDNGRRRICIDAACSMKGNLAMLCLDDGKVTYIEPKERVENVTPGSPGAQDGGDR